MNRGLFLFPAIILCDLIAWADEIYLTDGSMVRGKIVRITDTEVRYSVTAGEGKAPVLSETENKKNEGEGEPETVPENAPETEEERAVSREMVEKVIYDGGAVLTLKKEAAPDRLFLYDGHIMEGKVARITDRYVAFQYRGSEPLQIISRDLSDKVMFGDGREISLKVERPQAAQDPKNPAVEKKDVPEAPKKEEEKGRFSFTIGVIGAYEIWKPVWQKIINPFPYLFMDFSVDPAVRYGPEISFRLPDGFGVSGRFLYSRVRAKGYANTGPYMIMNDVRNEFFESELSVKYFLSDKIAVYGGLKYFGYLQRWAVTVSYLYLSSFRTYDHFHYHNAGPRVGTEFIVPVFWRLSLRGDLSGGLLFGYQRLDSTYKTSAYFFDLRGGVLLHFPSAHIAFTADYRWHLLKFLQFDNSQFHSGGRELMYGAQFGVRYEY